MLQLNKMLYDKEIKLKSTLFITITLTPARRTQLWNSANNSGVWYFVEPISQTPTWVHFHERFGKPSCPTGGFPQIKRAT